jgi:hypothetical protein
MSEVHEWTQYIHKSLVLNINRLPHHHVKAPIIRDLKVLGKVAGRKLGRKFRKVRLDVKVSYPARFSADASNYYPTMKAYVDGMVDIPNAVKGQKRQPARGCLTDDNDANFSGPWLEGTQQKSDRPDHFRFDCILTVLD